jgi:very-short-patch-repair endonuclease
VFASITDEDIDLERGKGKGVSAFKLFLHFARTGRLSLAQATARGHDSPFEEQVAKALTRLGYQVHPQVGIAGFFIDLAVADPERPGRYLLGIECDGASYHSSRSARDRDRLRQAVLEDHGWHIHRIWSTDWFQRPKEQLERVAAAIESAKAELAESASRASRAAPVEVVTIERDDAAEVDLDGASEGNAGATPYVEASLALPSGSGELHDAPVHQLADSARQVIEVEGPVHVAEVTARIRTLWGLQRAGGRIQAAIERAVQSLVGADQVVEAAGFLSLPGAEVRLRDRSTVASLGLRQPAMLPPTEIEVAIRRVVTDNLGASGEEIVLGVARLFGFKSTSAQLRDVIETVLASMIASGQLEQNGDHYGIVVPAAGTNRTVPTFAN